MLKRLIGLVRVSTEEQAEEGKAGLARQHESIRATAAQLGVPVDLIQIIGVSGSDVAETREWVEVIAPALGDHGTHLALDALDRLIRPDGYDFRTLKVVKETGSLIYLPGRVIDPTLDYLSTVVSAGVGGHEKIEIQRRVQRSKEEKRKRGHHPSADHTLPTGVVFDRAVNGWTYDAEIWKPRKAYRLVLSGETNIAEVGRQVGHTKQTVKGWLQNPIYRGWLIYDERRGAKKRSRNGRQPDRLKIKRPPEEVIRHQVYGLEGQDPAIVTEQEWEQVQDLLRRRRGRHRRVRYDGAKDIWCSTFLLSDVLITEPLDTEGLQRWAQESDRHVVYGHHRGKGGETRYICRCQHAHGDDAAPATVCTLPQLRADEVNTAVDAYLTHMSQDQSFHDAALRAASAVGGVSEGELALARGRVAELEAQLENLARQLMRGKMRESIYDKLEGEASEGLELAKRALIDLERRAVSKPQAQQVQDSLAELQWDASWDVKEKRSWLSRHCPAITISSDGIEAGAIRLGKRETLMSSLTVRDAMTWTELVGYDITNPHERWAHEGKLTAGRVAEALGLPNAKRWEYLWRRKGFPQPTGKIGCYHTWDPETVEQARAMLAEA